MLLADRDVMEDDVAWSPDGTRLAFRADKEVFFRYELYVVSSAGGEITKLSGPGVATADVGAYPGSPLSN